MLSHLELPVPFFPDPAFGWAFYTVVVGLMAVALYNDLTRAVVPKTVTLTTLGLGLLFNVVRGALQGAEGCSLWVLPEGNAWLGAADALVFAVGGAVVGFLMFFVLWIVRGCGGGDVKLMTAVGAWVGPVLVIYVVIGSALVLLAVVLLRVVWRVLVGGWSPSAMRRRMEQLRKSPRDARKGARKVGGYVRMTYALPVAVATSLILLWVCRVDLRLAEPVVPPNAEVYNNAQ
jgi:prepilin peptidase CpaA